MKRMTTNRRRGMTSYRSRVRAAFSLLPALMIGAMPAQVGAITFTIDYDEDARPAFDPNGLELQRMAQAAASIWSYYLEDSGNFQFDLSWDNLDGRLGKFEDLPFLDANIVLDTHAEDGTLRNWFFDPTPYENEEYSIYTSLYERDGDEADFFGSPPANLEIGYMGPARHNGPADGKIDALTSLLHEIGHYLGINVDLEDDNWDINPATLGGAAVAVASTDEDLFSLNHLDLETALMAQAIQPAGPSTRDERRLPSATDILVMWDEGGFTQIDLPRVDFIAGGSTSWDGALNWVGGRVPDADNEVFVRHGGQVRLTGNFSTAASLEVEENSSLAMADNNFLRVYGPVIVGGDGTGQVHIGGLSAGFPELEADSLRIHVGYVNLQSPSSILTVNGTLKIEPSGQLFGAGNVFARGLLANDGEILGGTFFGGGELILRTAFGGRLDLDGANEQGQISTSYGNLRVDGVQHEPFSGAASITPGRQIAFMQPFAIDGAVTLNGGSLLGTELFLRGRIDVTGNAGINAPLIVFDNPGQETTLRAGATLFVLPGRMGTGGSPDVYRGRIMLEENAQLLLNLGLASSWQLFGSMNMTNATVTGDDIVNTGVIRGSGTIYVGELENAGTVNVGDSIGVLHIGEGGRYVQTASGTLGIEAAGFRPGSQYDQLKVTLGATLDGTLTVDFIDGYLPSAGARFDVLTASSISGQFSALELFVPAGKFVEGRLLYGTDRVTLEILSSGLAADFDEDGDVDGDDLARWKAHFGPKTSLVHEEGDADGDGDADGADFLTWQQQVGSASTADATAAVPEPGTALLFVLGCAGFRRAAGRKR